MDVPAEGTERFSDSPLVCVSEGLLPLRPLPLTRTHADRLTHIHTYIDSAHDLGQATGPSESLVYQDTKLGCEHPLGKIQRGDVCGRT